MTYQKSWSITREKFVTKACIREEERLEINEINIHFKKV